MFNFQNFGDKGRKSHFLYNRCIHPRRSIALMFVTEKPEWWGCLTVKNLRICSAVSTEYRRVTDGQTDIYAYASRDKNQRGDITLTARRCEVSVRLSNIIFLIFYLFFVFPRLMLHRRHYVLACPSCCMFWFLSDSHAIGIFFASQKD